MHKAAYLKTLPLNNFFSVSQSCYFKTQFFSTICTILSTLVGRKIVNQILLFCQFNRSNILILPGTFFICWIFALCFKKVFNILWTQDLHMLAWFTLTCWVKYIAIIVIYAGFKGTVNVHQNYDYYLHRYAGFGFVCLFFSSQVKCLQPNLAY